MASSSSTPPRKYEVFLSFRGEDTRNSFVSHLYTALIQRGIVTYMDELNLEKGQSISPQLLKSTEGSKFAIIVFSRNYASSTWCLDELVKIMECRTKYGQTVIPIFYDVNPSDVRKQNNSFAESFANHEVNFKDNMERVQIWKENLREAANISGHDLSQRNVSEAACINKIVEEIFNILPRKASTKDLVGIENRVKKLSSLLAKEPNAVCFAGIWGMGGIGKTTTARAIFDELIDGFEGGCFLQDVSKRDMMDLQKILVSEVLKLEFVNINDGYQGSNIIRNRLSLKKVLLVLDDVNDTKQLELLAGAREWFGPGSRIIITTRDKHVLTEVNEIYELDTLSDSEAAQLFCWHAFKTTKPAENFVQLSDRVMNYAYGLPLALEVLGSYLRGRRMGDWESAIDILKNSSKDKIFVALEMSFHGLSDIQKDIFLDIACFFRRNPEDEVKRKLDSFGFSPMDGISVLIQKSLIHISDGKIEMHDLIQEMGWNIVHQKANKEPGRYSRLWRNDDIINVLTNNTGTVEIEGMELLTANFKLSQGAFRNMSKLRLLTIYRGNFSQAPNYLPNSLRWLYWSYYPAKSLPENFRPRNLVSLKLRNSSILQTPNFSDMPNLELLDLSYCEELIEVHPSIGVHRKLVELNLGGCYKLKNFPKVIHMESLEILILAWTKIRRLSWSPEGFTSLRKMDLAGCNKLKYLECIALFGCSKLKYPDNGSSKVLHALLSLPSLQKLHMSHCNVSELRFPESIGCLASLQELDLSGNKFASLPENINRFSSLQVLHISECKILEALPELPLSIKELGLHSCTALMRIPDLVDLLGKYKRLNHLSLAGCEQLVQKPVPQSLTKNMGHRFKECLQLGQNQETYDSPQANLLLQSVTQFLSDFWDWRSVSNILYTRQEMLAVQLPGTKFPDWLYQSSDKWSLVTVTLSPCCFNDKLRGFTLCAIGRGPQLTVVTRNGLLKSTPVNPSMTYYGSECSTFLYIPIGKITSDREWKEQKDSCLFEVNNFTNATSWRIRLVYEGDFDMDITDLTITNHYVSMDDKVAQLKVCVAPGSPMD